MEPISTQVTRTTALARGLFAAVLFVSIGCVSPNKSISKKHSPEVSPVAQVVTTWSNKVVYAPDPIRGGAIVPGLMGRLYLFGTTLGESIIADGKLVVDLYDHSKAGAEPALIEQWNIDPETLAKLVKEDTFGKGYTLFLPWSTYTKDLQKIHLIMRYDPVNGKSILNQSGTMTVDHTATMELVDQKK